MRVFLLSMLLLASFIARGTSQIPDVLLVDGESVELHTQPLADLLSSSPEIEESLARYRRPFCSASWLGFRATWEISHGRLFLAELVSDPCHEGGKAVPLRVFPGYADGKVFASWYSGNLVVPRGELVEYVHMGFESKYESYLIFSIQAGEVHEITEQQDRPGRSP